MASWARQRRSIYAAIVIVVLIGAVGAPVFFAVHKAPTCFDGLMNGNETGVDCGGSCQKLCQSAFLPPIVSWARFEELAPGLYNAGAYIINPNPAAGAVNVPYHIALYDASGVLITDVTGTVSLPPHRNSLAFKSSIPTLKRVPARALFEFTAPPQWAPAPDLLASLQVTGKQYSEDANGSSLSVSLKNESADVLGPLRVGAVLYDKDSNEIGFSETIVDQIAGRGVAVAPYTWPEGRNGAVVSIEVLPVAE